MKDEEYDEYNEEDLNTQDESMQDMDEDDGFASAFAEIDAEIKALNPNVKNEEEEKKKEYYVKGADLIREIKAYQDSKKTSPNGKGIISDELRNNDNEDLHKIFNAP